MRSQRVQALLDDIERAQQELDTQLDGISRKELHTPIQNGEWSIAQVLAHVCEVERHRTGKVAILLQEQDPLLDRTPQESQARLKAVEEHGRDGLVQIRQNLRQAHRGVLQTVRSLGARDLSRQGHRANGQRLTLETYLRTHLVQHLREHARQVAAIRKALAQEA